MNILLKLVNSQGRTVWHVYPDGDVYHVEHDHGGALYKSLDEAIKASIIYKETFARSSQAYGSLLKSYAA